MLPRGQPADRAAFDRIVGRFEARDGEALHRRVPPDRWCVSREDVRQFRALVRHALVGGLLAATPADPFDMSDVQVGPSICTVTCQLIKPITKQKGGPSWALMLHPDGLECDLFVTHCWAEGAFEFTDKVLHSWPRGARHAYCCMLSNPQNLDIGDLLSTPKDSPFARALSRAHFTLVVPNSKCSIYTRIWCVYEAYVSYGGGKVIKTARKTQGQPWLAAVALVAVAVTTGCLVCYGFHRRCLQGAAWTSYLVRGLLFLSCACALVARHSPAVVYAHVVGAASAGYALGHFWAEPTHYVPQDSTTWGMVACFCWLLNVIVWLALCEADRRWEDSAHMESVQLYQGYTGRLFDAKASAAQDRQRILREIREQGKECEVEHAIQVLINAGISTPGLRQADRLGVDVSGAGRWRASLVHAALTGLVAWPLLELAVGSRCQGAWTWLTELLLAEGCLWALTFCLFDSDRRSFAAPVAAVCVIFPGASCWLVQSIAAPGKYLLDDTCWADVLIGLVGGPLALVLSTMGVGVVASVPRCGPALAHWIFQGLSWRDIATVFLWRTRDVPHQRSFRRRSFVFEGEDRVPPCNTVGNPCMEA